MHEPQATQTPALATAGPLEDAERLHVVDALRGLALLGILAVNMKYFGQPFLADFLPEARATFLGDRIATWVVRLFFEAKFYVLFSFLFGFGFAIQMERAAARGRRFWTHYLRRATMLLAIGLAHGLLLWAGDILSAYAVFGLLLLLVRGLRPRTLLIIAFLLLGIHFLLGAAQVGVLWLLGMFTSTPELEKHILGEGDFVAEIRAIEHAYKYGTFAELTRARAGEYGMAAGLILAGMLPSILGMFTLGLAVAKLRILHEPQNHLRLLRITCAVCLPIGLLLNLFYAPGADYGGLTRPTGIWSLATVSALAGAPVLMLGYASGFVLLWQGMSARPWLARLAPAGRMALTNYLLQSLICTTLCYSYGLRLYGQIGPLLGLALTLAIYLTQVTLSPLWLRRFRFGPMEWLWRTATYLRPPRMTAPDPAGQVR